MRNLLEGLPGTPETNPEVAVNIEARLAGMSWSAAWGILHAADPVYAASIEENDWRRLERALNIIEVSGRPVSSFKSKAEVAYDYRCVYLTAPRLNLFARIDGRCERMVEDGLVEEVIGLANQGLNPTMPAAGVLGYGLPIPLVHALTSAQGRVTSCL